MKGWEQAEMSWYVRGVVGVAKGDGSTYDDMLRGRVLRVRKRPTICCQWWSTAGGYPCRSVGQSRLTGRCQGISVVVAKGGVISISCFVSLVSPLV